MRQTDLSHDGELERSDVLEDRVMSRLEEQSSDIVVNHGREGRVVNDAIPSVSGRLATNQIAAARQLPRRLDAVEGAALRTTVQHFRRCHRLERLHVNVRVLPTQLSQDVDVLVPRSTTTACTHQSLHSCH